MSARLYFSPTYGSKIRRSFIRCVLLDQLFLYLSVRSDYDGTSVFRLDWPIKDSLMSWTGSGGRRGIDVGVSCAVVLVDVGHGHKLRLDPQGDRDGNRWGHVGRGE
jgi:hypothetical protein